MEADGSSSSSTSSSTTTESTNITNSPNTITPAPSPTPTIDEVTWKPHDQRAMEQEDQMARDIASIDELAIQMANQSFEEQPDPKPGPSLVEIAVPSPKTPLEKNQSVPQTLGKWLPRHHPKDQAHHPRDQAHHSSCRQPSGFSSQWQQLCQNKQPHPAQSILSKDGDNQPPFHSQCQGQSLFHMLLRSPVRIQISHANTVQTKISIHWIKKRIGFNSLDQEEVCVRTSRHKLVSQDHQFWPRLSEPWHTTLSSQPHGIHMIWFYMWWFALIHKPPTFILVCFTMRVGGKHGFHCHQDSKKNMIQGIGNFSICIGECQRGDNLVHEPLEHDQMDFQVLRDALSHSNPLGQPRQQGPRVLQVQRWWVYPIRKPKVLRPISCNKFWPMRSPIWKSPMYFQLWPIWSRKGKPLPRRLQPWHLLWANHAIQPKFPMLQSFSEVSRFILEMPSCILMVTALPPGVWPGCCSMPMFLIWQRHWCSCGPLML